MDIIILSVASGTCNQMHVCRDEKHFDELGVGVNMQTGRADCVDRRGGNLSHRLLNKCLDGQ